MRVLVTGASGFVGSLLAPRLCADGHLVRAFGRNPERIREALSSGAVDLDAERVEILSGDALTGVGLDRAMTDVEVAYYLLHSMERSSADASSFVERERIAAERFADAAARAGVRRIVYLGGLLPRSEEQSIGAATQGGLTSAHLASRAEVEDILSSAVADSLALRASIVIGAGSRSFRLLVHLVERLPILTLPAWQRFRTRPIDARDVIEMLVAAATAQPSKRSLDVGGPDTLTYGEMLTRIADLMLIRRPAVRLRVNVTPVAARVAAAIANEDPELVVPLMEGLQCDLLPAEDHAEELLGVRMHSFDSAVEHALAEWEQLEPLAAR
jgi:uncharacterized protein YbjT (DUF2867 family)